jgi:hypothetical protein
VDLLAFIAVKNHADDVTRVVDVGVGYYRGIRVTTPHVGAPYLINPLADLRGAEDVAGC